MDYNGYKCFELNDEQLAEFYDNPNSLINELKINEYGIIQKDNKEIEFCCRTTDGVQKIGYPKIGCDFTGTIKPRNPQQRCAMDLLLRRDVPVKLLTGHFGSGKTILCIVAAIEQIYKHKFDKIIFVRNNVQVKNTDPLGALPGTEFDKTLPYLMPFADHCGGIEGIRYLMSEEKLEVIPLGFLRGRSIRNSIIYSMESENLTKEHIQLILGRVDEGSELWMDGDLKQRDRSVFEKSMGLEILNQRLTGNPLYGHVHLIKSERSPVSALADLLD